MRRWGSSHQKAMEIEAENNAKAPISKLIQVVSRLRDPQNGCPWDIEQTHSSLIPFVIEEANEVADAIRNGSDENLKEELGDLLLQVVLHAQIAKEEQRFSFDDIANEICSKLIRRHPHVFEKNQSITREEVSKNWEAIKLIEKPSTPSKSPFTDRLRHKIRSQSGLAGATHISKKTADLGFEWETINEVWEKFNEEIDELKQALQSKDISNAQEELGDVFFTLINVARWYGLSPEEGLAGTNKRFLDRFSYIESALDGKLSGQSISKFAELWEAAKKHLRQINKEQ